MNGPDVREMRVALEKAAITGVFEPNGNPVIMRKPSFSAAIVRRVRDVSRYTGLSGEDQMTWLAYELLQASELLFQQHCAHLNAQPIGVTLVIDENTT